MASAPSTDADTIRSFETGSEKRSGASGELGRTGPFRGTRFFSSFFHKMFTKYMPGLKPSQTSQMCLPRSPHAHQGGRSAPRVLSSTVCLVLLQITCGFVLRPRREVYSTNFVSFGHHFHPLENCTVLYWRPPSMCGAGGSYRNASSNHNLLFPTVCLTTAQRCP